MKSIVYKCSHIHVYFNVKFAFKLNEMENCPKHLLIHAGKVYILVLY